MIIIQLFLMPLTHWHVVGFLKQGLNIEVKNPQIVYSKALNFQELLALKRKQGTNYMSSASNRG